MLKQIKAAQYAHTHKEIYETHKTWVTFCMLVLPTRLPRFWVLTCIVWVRWASISKFFFARASSSRGAHMDCLCGRQPAACCKLCLLLRFRAYQRPVHAYMLQGLYRAIFERVLLPQGDLGNFGHTQIHSRPT